MRRPSRPQRLVLIVLLAVAAAFVLVDSHADASSPLAGVRSTLGSVLGPVQRGGAYVVSPVVGAARALGSIGSDQRRAERLQRENSTLRGQLRAQALSKSRLQQLAALDLLAGRGQYRVVPGHVIALGAQRGFGWTATVDCGRRDGVRADQTVVAGSGLVGRITTVTATTATVLLAIDPSSAVGVRLEGSRELGIADGTGLSPMRVQLLDPRAAVHVGDRLVTGPYGVSTFAAGVPVGRVTAVQGGSGGIVRTASVQSYVEFSAVDVVGVIVVGPRADPRDSVLPPRPSSTPSAGAR